MEIIFANRRVSSRLYIYQNWCVICVKILQKSSSKQVYNKYFIANVHTYCTLLHLTASEADTETCVSWI